MSKDPHIDDPSRLGLLHRLRFLAKDSILYGGAAALNKAFALITFPLLARHFSVEDYGTIDFFNVTAALLVTLFVFGQDSAVARYFYEHKENHQRRQIISQSLAFQLGLLALIIPPARLLLSHDIAGLLSPSGHVEPLLKIVLLQVPFLLLINFSQNILKWTFARSRFLIISIGSTVCSVSALLLCLIQFDLNVVNVFQIYLATQALFSLLGVYFCRAWLTWPSNWSFLRELFLFAAPYGIICAIGAFMPAMERSFIVRFLHSDALGIYAVGAKIAMLIALPIQAFQVAWGPFSLALHKEADATATYNWVLKIFTFGACLLVLLLTLLAGPVIKLLATERYFGATVLVFPMALSLTIQATSWITAIGIGLSKKSYLNIYSYGIFMSVSALAIYVLIQPFGIAGVAWGAMSGYVAKAVTESWLSQRVYPIQWALKGTISLWVITIVAGVVSGYLATVMSMQAGYLWRGMALLLVLAAGWKILFTRDELTRIAYHLQRIKSRMQSA